MYGNPIRNPIRNTNSNQNQNTMPITNGNTKSDSNQTTTTTTVSTSNQTSTNPTCCVLNELREILRLQRRASTESCLSCSGKELGENVLNNNRYNTRPFILYLINGDEFRIRIADFFNGEAISAATTNNPESTSNTSTNRLGPTTSNIFRVEEINGTCCRLRALKLILGKYYATCFCCTIDACDCIAIQCLTDTFVSNLTCTT